MGFPINSYQVMRAFMDNARDPHLVEVRDALRDLKLFAFVIHDPKEHSLLHEKLNASFDLLDYSSGHSLLFFALVNPPATWKRYSQNRRYVNEFNFYVERLQQGMSEPGINNSSLTAFAIAKALGLPDDSLPAIIVTPSLSFSKFIHIPTNAYSIHEQLQTLGMVAERTESINDQDLLEEAINELEASNLGMDCSVGRLPTSLANRLADWLAAITSGNNSFDWMADSQAVDALNRLQKLVSKYKQEGYSGSNLEQVSEELTLMIAVSSPPFTEAEVFQHWQISPNDLEPNSCIFLETGYLVDKYMSTLHTKSGGRGSIFELKDWSPVAISVAKAFEYETNFSFVHWIRQHMGVSLPAYFNRPQPGVNANFNGTDFNANFGGSHLLKPIEIGRSLKATQHLADIKPLPQPITPHDWEFIQREWLTIRNIRNQAAHAEFVDQIHMSGLSSAIQALGEADAFGKMASLKRQYRGY